MVHARYANQGGYKMIKKVYIDGANIVHVDRKTTCALRLETAYNELIKHEFDPHILLPNYMRKKIDDPEIVKKLERKGQLSFISNGGDEAIITSGYNNNGFTLTNDRYNNHKNEAWCTPDIKKFIESKLIPFDFIEGMLSISLNVLHRLNNQLNDSPAPLMSVSDFKSHATNGGVSPDISFEVFPEPVQEMLKLIQENSGEITLAALGSQLKNATGYKPNDLFGNAKHASRFLKSRGYPIRHDEGNTYVKEVAA